MVTLNKSDIIIKGTGKDPIAYCNEFCFVSLSQDYSEPGMIITLWDQYNAYATKHMSWDEFKELCQQAWYKNPIALILVDQDKLNKILFISKNGIHDFYHNKEMKIVNKINNGRTTE